MGTNLLRFSHFLQHDNVPVTAIVTGENNADAVTLSKRECFDAIYSGAKQKIFALDHLCKTHGITQQQVAFFFDDVLDLDIAAKCGIRILAGRKNTPLFNQFVEQRALADYITSTQGGQFAVREAAELLIGIRGNFDGTLVHRIGNTEVYKNYLKVRNSKQTEIYTITDSQITQL
jgi:3-deoxy-D-manno-octulosonate 8-phosphate phosphatase (KDO 8-P phosphatase)